MPKITLDDKEVPSRVYYYLLDWNERDEWKTIYYKFGLNRLCDMTKEQIVELFSIATHKEMVDMNGSPDKGI